MASEGSLSETYLKSKRYVVFFSAALVLNAVVGLGPAESNLLGWSVANPKLTGLVVYLIVGYYLIQLDLFWNAQGEQIRKLPQHRFDYRMSNGIAYLALYSLPISILFNPTQRAPIDSAPVATLPIATLLLAIPIIATVAYRRLLQPELTKSRDAAAVAEESILSVITAHSWQLVFNPIAYEQTNGSRGSKEITFNPDGNVAEGRNANETTWRITSGFLEILNAAGRIFSRFRFDPTTERFVSTDDRDLLAIRGQVINKLRPLTWG